MKQNLHIPMEYSHMEITNPLRSKCAGKQKKGISFILLPVYCSSLCFINTYTPKHTLSSLPNYGINLTGNHENFQPRVTSTTFDDLPGGKNRTHPTEMSRSKNRALPKISPTWKWIAKALREHSYKSFEQNATTLRKERKGKEKKREKEWKRKEKWIEHNTLGWTCLVWHYTLRSFKPKNQWLFTFLLIFTNS